MDSGSPKIDFLGSATSGFQAHPFFRGLHGNGGESLGLSDWEFELNNNFAGRPSGISQPQRLEDLPQFFKKKGQYIKRSAELGENMFRFSLEMPRLCPRRGEFNEEHMAENVRVLAIIRAHGQEPMVTINHFTMPISLTDTDRDDEITAGGWEDPEVLHDFRFYIESVARFLGDEDKMRKALESGGIGKQMQDRLLAEGLVKYFMSINEPATVVGNGYLFGVFPPFRKGRVDLIGKVLDTMVEAHDIARSTLKELGEKMNVPSDRRPHVGGGYNWNYFDGLLGDTLHALIDRGITDKFERNATSSDFLALQYYFRMTIPRFSKKGRDYGDHPAFGDMYPAGILEILKKMHAAYPDKTKPIFITEMGFADAQDTRRPYWICETMRYVLAAANQGIPVKGVLLWSLVSNFEWDQGMGVKFGLFDERELDQPLVPSDPHGAKIRSWEVWAAIIDAIRRPSEESRRILENCSQRAWIQARSAHEEQ